MTKLDKYLTKEEKVLLQVRIPASKVLKLREKLKQKKIKLVDFVEATIDLYLVE